MWVSGLGLTGEGLGFRLGIQGLGFKVLVSSQEMFFLSSCSRKVAPGQMLPESGDLLFGVWCFNTLSDPSSHYPQGHCH